MKCRREREKTGENKQVVFIPTKRVGKLVGKQGIMINMIRDQTQAVIVVKTDNAEDNRTPVIIRAARPEQIKLATTLIEEAIGEGAPSLAALRAEATRTTAKLSSEANKGGAGSGDADSADSVEETAALDEVSLTDDDIGDILYVSFAFDNLPRPDERHLPTVIRYHSHATPLTTAPLATRFPVPLSLFAVAVSRPLPSPPPPTSGHLRGHG